LLALIVRGRSPAKSPPRTAPTGSSPSSSRKLQRHGVKKIVPENKNETFGLFVRNQQVGRIIRRELKKLNGDGNAKPPFNLSAQVRRYPVEESIGAVG
jgi:hypothetical protein